MSMALQTRSLRLRPLAATDLQGLTALLHEEPVRRHLLDGRIMPQDWLEAQIGASAARFDSNSLGLFAAARREEPAVLAGIAGGIVTAEDSEPELIYALAPALWGRGLALEMAQAIVDFTFGRLGWPRLTASVDAPNRRSVAVLERLGFDRMPGDAAHRTVIRYTLDSRRWSGSGSA